MYLFICILCIGHTSLGSNSASWSKFIAATLRQDSKTRTLFLYVFVFGSDLLNTIKDMVSLFGANLHGGVISGRWCLKLVFGLILLSFSYRLCHVDSPNLWVRGTREYLICSYKCWRRISSCILTRILLESPCSISNMMLKCVDIHIVEGSLEVKLPTMRTDEKQRWEESEKRREEER